MSRTYYIYEHWRPDKDACFYVGKGHGKRCRVMYNRGPYHTHIQAHLARNGFEVEIRIIMDGLTEDEAFYQEKRRINYWKLLGATLANKTEGGEGNSNPSKETRQLMRLAKLGRKLTEEHKAKISARTKEVLNKPEMKERLSIAIRKAQSTPEYKANMSRAQKARVRTKEHYEKVANSLRGRKLSPEHIEAMRIGHLGQKPSQETIEKRRLATTGKKRSPEFCAQMKDMWTEERKAQQAEIQRSAMTPERRARDSARRIAQNKSPEFREKLKAAWVIRKEKKANALLNTVEGEA